MTLTQTRPPARPGPWPFVARGELVDDLAAALPDTGVGVLHLTGPSGVGKTRLATALLEWAEGDGYPVARVRASRDTAAVPLSALTTLLPPDVLAGASTALVTAALEHVRSLGDGTRVVVLVDDVDLLEPASLAVLSQLVEEDLVLLVTTARDDVVVPELLHATFRQGRLRRVEVRPLDRRGTGTLLHLALEGPVAAPLEQVLWDLAGGSPLFLRELVRAGRESGALRRVDGVWTLASPIGTSSGLRDLVAGWLGDLPTEARAALDLLALCSVVAVEDLEDAAGAEALEGLEESGLVEVEPSPDGLQVRLAHPVYAQVLRESMPRLRARRLLLAQVARVEGRGAARHGDVLRVARWRLEADGTADPALLLQAARLARAGHAYAEIERLCRAALAVGPDPEASLLLGEALYESGRFAEADRAFADAVDGAPAGRSGRFALHRAYNAFFGLGRLEDALVTLATAAEEDGEAAPDLHAIQAFLLTHGGRSREAHELLATLGPQSHPELVTRARALVLLRSGHLEEAARVAQEAWDAADDTGQFMHPSGSLMIVGLARRALGQSHAATAAVEEAERLATQQGVEFQALWLRWVQALLARAEGDLALAAERATEVLASATAAGIPAPARLAAATLTTVTAERGLVADVPALVERLQTISGPRELYGVWVEVALGWAEAVTGDRTAALTRWRAAAEDYLDRGELLSAAEVLHEGVRLGDRRAAEDLAALADRVDGDLHRARVMHAHGVDGDALALTVAADLYASLGQHLLAAETAATAAGLDALGRRERSRLAALAAAERTLCPGAATPALATTGASSGLTARERQIATLAASGATSREIAEQLVLSVRTVDNHLQNAYTKLGVSGRSQLAARLAGDGVAS